MKPYTDVLTTENTIIREFGDNIDPVELKWHMDSSSRHVTILEGKGWKYQGDNKLPLELNEGDSIFIPKQTFHRIYKGKTPLKIKINQ
jgi:quercetin dioxygenase-like cupin family protein